ASVASPRVSRRDFSFRRGARGFWLRAFGLGVLALVFVSDSRFERRYWPRTTRGLLRVKEPGIAGAQEEHWCSKLSVVACGKDRLARLRERGVDWEALNERVVQPACECDRGLVSDLELHPDHRRDAALDKTRRGAGERVDVGRSRAFAGVEHHQAEAAFVLQQRAELFAGHFVRLAIGVLEHQDAALGARVISAMTDVVQDVD